MGKQNGSQLHHSMQPVVRTFATLNWRHELKQAVLIYVLGGTFQQAVLNPGSFSEFPDVLQLIAMNGAFWVSLWKGSEYMVLVVRYLDLHWTVKPLKTFLVAITLIVTFTALMVFIITGVFSWLVLDRNFEQFLQSLRLSYFVPTIFFTVLINMFMHGRAFLLEWRASIVEVERFKSESLRAQYESLKNQVNPHFLFNSLNALSSLVYDDQDKAVEFIRKLSLVYRYVLDHKDMELVPVKDELAFLENYIFLQQIRFGENLQVNIQKSSESGMIPPVSLQILVENAIKHNVVSTKRPLTVEISITESAATVRNNLQLKTETDSTGIGLSNLRARYAYLSEQPVVIDQSANHFAVTLPILKFQP